MSYTVESSVPLAAKFLQEGDIITYRTELRMVAKVDVEDDHVRVHLSNVSEEGDPRFPHVFDCRAYDMIPFNGDVT